MTSAVHRASHMFAFAVLAMPASVRVAHERDEREDIHGADRRRGSFITKTGG